MAVVPPTGLAPETLVNNIEITGPARETASLKSEQRLIDYIARLQAQGVTTQNFNNPAGMAGEALKTLKGYLERATSLNDNPAAKVHGMNQSENAGGMAQADSEAKALPSGPAGQNMEPAQAAEKGRAEAAGGITQGELERLGQVLTDIMRYGTETSIVTSATGNISKSVTTLLRGQ